MQRDLGDVVSLGRRPPECVFLPKHRPAPLSGPDRARRLVLSFFNDARENTSIQVTWSRSLCIRSGHEKLCQCNVDDRHARGIDAPAAQ